MATFAEKTSVSSEKSKAEIERTLQRYGASQFMYGWDGDSAVVGFQMEGRQIRFILAMPDPYDDEFVRTPAKKQKRTNDQRIAAWEQACRQKWRALALVVKAKLEAVESGITTFDSEFLAHILLPDGGTVGDFMTPQVEQAYNSGTMPQMLELNK